MNDSCFVFGYQLDGTGKARAIEPESDAQSEHSSPATWYHLDYSAGDAERWLRDRGIEPNVAETLVRSDTRPRMLAAGNGVLVVLRGVNANPGAEPEDMVSLRMWIEKNRLISIRQRRLLSAQDVRETLEEGKGPRDIPELVTAIIERVADRISDFVDTIETHIGAYEEDVETDDPDQVRRDVTALRRQTAVVRRFLAPQRDALDNLYRHSHDLLDEDQMYTVREQSDRITRYVEDLDLIRERALVVQEELMNKIAQEQNSRMYVLSVVAAVFLPITFISGLFGMNVAGLPGTEEPISFWLVSGVMLAISAGVMGLFWLKRWF